jgi:L-threonylcarbamoyladenylate synthase
MEKRLEQAVRILKEGGLIVFPTDTAFGVGCRMDNKRAVERLFKWRRRPKDKAVPVLVDSTAMAQKYLLPIPGQVKNLMKKYWPGALTIVLPCQTEKVPNLVRAGGQTLGVRMPNHPIPLTIINAIDVPILGPSANFHGQPTPYNFEDLDKEFLKGVDFVIPGECLLKGVSTVVDCSVFPWKILRAGVIKLKLL